jgi:hypothetical protein
VFFQHPGPYRSVLFDRERLEVDFRIFAWRGEPLYDYETMISIICGTQTAQGLKVSCKLDHRKYPTGRKVTDEEMDRINIKRAKFHGDWNYVISPK